MLDNGDSQWSAWMEGKTSIPTQGISLLKAIHLALFTIEGKYTIISGI